MINHCDRRITLLSDTDTVVVSHGMINHCDRPITLPSDTDTVVRYNVVIPVLYHRYHLCLWLYCISITKMSDTSTLSQLSPVSDCTVSVSPRWVIPVLYWYSTVSDISDNCDRVHVSLILVIPIQYSQRQVITVIEYRYHSSWWYTVLYQYHQDKWYLYSITVITYVSDYCISITKLSDTCTLSQLSPMSLTTCDRVQVSLILVILIQ
jgi:hypothetical protein